MGDYRFTKLSDVFANYHKKAANDQKRIERAKENADKNQDNEIKRIIQASTLDMGDCVKRLSKIDSAQILPCPRIVFRSPTVNTKWSIGPGDDGTYDDHGFSEIVRIVNSSGGGAHLTFNPGLKVRRPINEKDSDNFNNILMPEHADTVVTNNPKNILFSRRELNQKQMEVLKKYPKEIFSNFELLYNEFGDENGKIQFSPYNLDGRHTEGDETNYVDVDAVSTDVPKPLVNAYTFTGPEHKFLDRSSRPTDIDVKKVMKDILMENYNGLSK